ncbi:MAG: hypothetical protein H6Q90_5640 [Deltaproteobacteria bacterium]|nr:hypothetical protein [Deltaproteobacteria bacterium]
MIALAAAFALLAACTGKGKPPTKAAGTQLLVKRVSLSWGFQVEGEMTDVFLATTDETGKQVSHPIGRYKGTCAKITPAKEMGSPTGAACTTPEGGTELHAVVQGNQVVVMQMRTQPGATPDPMAREEVTRVGVPLGAEIEAAP